jgi:predicted double-glycine peptidase
VASAAVAAAPPPGAKPVRSLGEIRGEQVIRQEWDLSCGAAAVATLLTYQLGHPVTEREVALALTRRSTPALVRSRGGFSLLDLKIYAATQGFAAEGFSDMDLDDLDAAAPAIVPMRTHGFRHFVVYRGRSDGLVLVADPAFGNRTMPEASFRKGWAGGVGFVVFDAGHPHPPNRMGAPAELFLDPGRPAQRVAVFGPHPPAAASPFGSAP